MDDCDNFYMLAGGTAGTLIGLAFVVITLGIDHAKAGDEIRTRLFVTPVLVRAQALAYCRDNGAADIVVNAGGRAWRDRLRRARLVRQRRGTGLGTTPLKSITEAGRLRALPVSGIRSA